MLTLQINCVAYGHPALISWHSAAQHFSIPESSGQRDLRVQLTCLESGQFMAPSVWAIGTHSSIVFGSISGTIFEKFMMFQDSCVKVSTKYGQVQRE
jgi:hypothetical protein